MTLRIGLRLRSKRQEVKIVSINESRNEIRYQFIHDEVRPYKVGRVASRTSLSQVRKGIREGYIKVVESDLIKSILDKYENN